MVQLKGVFVTRKTNCLSILYKSKNDKFAG